MVLYIIGIIFVVIIVNFLFNEWEELKERADRGSKDLQHEGYHEGKYESPEDTYDSFRDDVLFEDKNNSSKKINPNIHASKKEWKVPVFLRKKHK